MTTSGTGPGEPGLPAGERGELAPDLLSRVGTTVDPASLVPDWEYRFRHYVVRFARGERDLDACCRLRFDVFNVELGEGLAESERTRRDRDAYDDQCQHLMVIDTKSNTVVGTYRLQVREGAEAGIGFYSASEFDLSSLSTELVDGLVELGRACTAKAHRTRAVLNLLWRGMVAYLAHNRRRYFFGCSSLTSQDPALGLDTYEHLRLRGYLHPSVELPPLPGYECVADGPSRTRVEIPTLFTLYLRQGAKVCGPPALDRFFGTIDFLTLVDTKTMDQAILRSYS